MLGTLLFNYHILPFNCQFQGISWWERGGDMFDIYWAKLKKKDVIFTTLTSYFKFFIEENLEIRESGKRGIHDFNLVISYLGIPYFCKPFFNIQNMVNLATKLFIYLWSTPPISCLTMEIRARKVIISAFMWLHSVNCVLQRIWISLYKSASLSVSEWVCVCVWMFPNSSETANPSELKFWGMIPLGIGKVLG